MNLNCSVQCSTACLPSTPSRCAISKGSLSATRKNRKTGIALFDIQELSNGHSAGLLV